MNKIDYGKTGNLKNFTENALIRYIKIDDSIMNESGQKIFFEKTNEKLNHLIQDINAYTKGRVLPFVKVQRVIEENEKLRIVINDLDDKTTYVDRNNLSLLINFRLPTAQRIITVCDELIKGDAKMIIDVNSQESAVIDIMLDIAMFHSYSFLDVLKNAEKQDFNKIKYDFFVKNNCTSFYLIDEDKPPKFLSFAFAARARDEINSFDIIKYCDIWDDFIENKFSHQVHINIPPEQQMLMHLQEKMIDKRYFSSEFWSNFSSGDYMFIRIHREPNRNDDKQELARYFNIPKFHVGATKIVPISEYYKPYFKRLLNENYISAFKIVVD